MNNSDIFFSNIADHEKTLKKMDSVAGDVSKAGDAVSKSLMSGGRVFFCGNGGSAADSQHLAAELSGRYIKERRPLDGIALHCNTSAMTAIGNDYSFDEVFARQLLAHGRSGDVLVVISTSGNSMNIIRAIETAREIGMVTIGMTGLDGGKIRYITDILISVPSDFTPRIQEMHIMVGHVMCEIVECKLNISGAEEYKLGE